MPEDGAEATFAPGQDLSLESTEMLLEDMASTMLGAEINKIFQLHYDVIEFGEWKSQLIDCKSLDMAIRNATQISKSGSVNPASVKITSHTVITTPPVEHQIQEKEPEHLSAPRFKIPEEHPYIPKK